MLRRQFTPPPPVRPSPNQLQLFDPAASRKPPDLSGGLSPEMTLFEIYQAAIRRQHVAVGDGERNLDQLDCSMNYWVAFTGDPPLCEIVQPHSTATIVFVEGLWTLPGRRHGTKATAQTVHKHCRTVQSVLDRTRRRCRRTNPLGLDLVDDVPLIEKPDLPEDDVEDNYTLEEIALMLRACPQLEATTLDYGPFPGWWHDALLFDYNVGVRVGSLLKLRFAWLRRDELGSWIVVPREFVKVFKRQRFYLNAYAVTIADRMRQRVKVSDDRLFPWDLAESWLYNVFRRLLAIAGLPAERTYGNKFHGLRKAMATELGKINAIAEKMAMGRGKRDVDIRSYVHRCVLVESLNKLPQPAD